jgi:hypothetical protein
MKSAFLITAAMLSGVVGVFGIPTTNKTTTKNNTITPQNTTALQNTAAPQNTTALQNTTSSQNTGSGNTNTTSPGRFAAVYSLNGQHSPPANITGAGPGPKESWMCYSVDKTSPQYAVGYGISQETAAEATQSKCGNECTLVGCTNESQCVAAAYGIVVDEDREGEQINAALVIEAIRADSQQARAFVEGVAVGVCETLIGGPCYDLGAVCI